MLGEWSPLSCWSGFCLVNNSHFVCVLFFHVNSMFLIAALLSTIFISQADKLANVGNSVCNWWLLDIIESQGLKHFVVFVDKIYQNLKGDEIQLEQEEEANIMLDEEEIADKKSQKSYDEAVTKWNKLQDEFGDKLFHHLIESEKGKKASDKLMGQILKIFYNVPKCPNKTTYRNTLYKIITQLIKVVENRIGQEYDLKMEKLKQEKQAQIHKLANVDPTLRKSRLEKIENNFDLSMKQLNEAFDTIGSNVGLWKYDNSSDYLSDIFGHIDDKNVQYIIQCLLMNTWFDFVVQENQNSSKQELLCQALDIFSLKHVTNVMNHEVSIFEEITKRNEVLEKKTKGKEGRRRMDQRV